jgi:hypothetical protein
LLLDLGMELRLKEVWEDSSQISHGHKIKSDFDTYGL